MKLETARLILRSPAPADVEDFLEFRNSEFVLRYNAMTPASREKTLSQFAQRPEQENCLLLEQKATGTVIGAVFWEEDSLRWGISSKELSYFMHEAHTRKGYMKEALRALIPWLFETENLTCVAARSFAPNTASRALLESLGFHQDGLIRKCVKGYGDVIFDDNVYSLFREEFV